MARGEGSLPREILCLIFSFFDYASTLGQAALVCTLWHEISCDNQLWKILYNKSKLNQQPKTPSASGLLLFDLKNQNPSLSDTDPTDYRKLYQNDYCIKTKWIESASGELKMQLDNYHLRVGYWADELTVLSGTIFLHVSSKFPAHGIYLNLIGQAHTPNLDQSSSKPNQSFKFLDWFHNIDEDDQENSSTIYDWKHRHKSNIQVLPGIHKINFSVSFPRPETLWPSLLSSSTSTLFSISYTFRVILSKQLPLSDVILSHPILAYPTLAPIQTPVCSHTTMPLTVSLINKRNVFVYGEEMTLNFKFDNRALGAVSTQKLRCAFYGESDGDGSAVSEFFEFVVEAGEEGSKKLTWKLSGEVFKASGDQVRSNRLFFVRCQVDVYPATGLWFVVYNQPLKEVVDCCGD
eukprot:TRINITY_DN1096_c0_g1_i1.p1 TRINITY_DN1096_c0_g1~~TRINITY_DN1096_c0_g1_i1.p1  ORF type:complete len:406 (+),score=52.52 TRINITY_DN1096_c0_g1_i1:50-1267(+)